MSIQKATKPDPFVIQSSGDLEVAVLYEAHDLLAQIISGFLYQVHGPPGQQLVRFTSAETFDLFSIRVGEFLAESTETSRVDGAPANLSLLSGLEWVSQRLAERNAPVLREDVLSLQSWMDTVDEETFWCGGLGRRFFLRVERRQLWKTHANLCKHTPFRLGDVMKKLQRWTRDETPPVEGVELLELMRSFREWIRGYAEHHATKVAELFGHVFASLNQVVWERWEANGRTNHCDRIRHPPRTSLVYAGVHTELLAFKRYTDDRISAYIPSTFPTSSPYSRPRE